MFPNYEFRPTLGDPGDPDAPHKLRTKCKLAYYQGEHHYCLGYSLANALNYCGYNEQSQTLAGHAELLSRMPLPMALNTIRNLMAALTPDIGGPVVYNLRTGKKRKRQMTVDQLLNDKTRYPTLVIPTRPDGSRTHAFCVVDDLIFDSITIQALKLCHESLEWIFNDEKIELHAVLRFQQRTTKSSGPYSYHRQMITHS